MAEKGKILVVDNESDQLDLMKDILERIGYEAITTDNPQQALEMVQNKEFCRVIIDLIMPEIDGTELCEQIKLARPSTSVYAFSGHVHLYSPERLKQAGFIGAINKPVTMEEIKKALTGNQEIESLP
jgi:DNA-binding NtrC family response regulator